MPVAHYCHLCCVSHTWTVTSWASSGLLPVCCATLNPKRMPSCDRQLPYWNDNVYTCITWTEMATVCDTMASLLAVREPRLAGTVRSPTWQVTSGISLKCWPLQGAHLTQFFGVAFFRPIKRNCLCGRKQQKEAKHCHSKTEFTNSWNVLQIFWNQRFLLIWNLRWGNSKLYL